MSGFKVGDVVVIVGDGSGISKNYQHCIGKEATVTEVFDWFGNEACRLSAYDPEGTGWYSIALRLRRPPTRDDAEPLDTFTPAPPEFVDDLRRMMKREVVS